MHSSQVHICAMEYRQCCERWNSPNFVYKKISDELRETLTQCGLVQVELGPTYLADRLGEDGNEIVSSIDFIQLQPVHRLTSRK